MRRFALIVLALAASAAVANGVSYGDFAWRSQNDGFYGIPPSGSTAGVEMAGATRVRVSVDGVDGTVTGGSVCGYYLRPVNMLGDGGWQLVSGLKRTLSPAAHPDGGALRSVTLSDITSSGTTYGRLGFVSCGLTGTADDGGDPFFQVTTEAIGGGRFIRER